MFLARKVCAYPHDCRKILPNIFELHKHRCTEEYISGRIFCFQLSDKTFETMSLVDLHLRSSQITPSNTKISCLPLYALNATRRFLVWASRLSCGFRCWIGATDQSIPRSSAAAGASRERPRRQSFSPLSLTANFPLLEFIIPGTCQQHDSYFQQALLHVFAGRLLALYPSHILFLERSVHCLDSSLALHVGDRSSNQCYPESKRSSSSDCR